MRAIGSLAIIAFSLTFSNCCDGQLILLENAHSHNDYLQANPLTDALDRGFTSIEADVFLKGGRLMITHAYPLFHHDRTLESMYLQPLRKIALQNNGHIFKDSGRPLILLIDVKSEAAETYKALQLLLGKYAEFLSSMENGKFVNRAVTIIISGHRPLTQVKDSTVNNMFIDRPLTKLISDSSTTRMASEKYRALIHWKGKGNLGEEERKRLTALCSVAHARGEIVRLWASPENEKVWEQLLRCGVDLINTDQQTRLQHFLLKRKEPTVLQ